MAHFCLMLRACRVIKLKKIYEQEKLNSIKIEEGEEPKYTARQKCRHWWINLRLKLKNCCKLPENKRIGIICYKLKHPGSLENYILKSILGFLVGCLLTYLLFIFLVVLLNFTLAAATVMCIILGCILTIGLAFSSNCRCIVFLTLPQFFSKRGRQAILAYALILAISGPIKNTMNNVEILNESLACEQEQLKAILKQILNIIKKPFVAIKDAIKTVVQKIKEIMKKIKEILVKIKRVIMAILKVIKSAFLFLGRMLNMCSKELGTPFERCSKVFEKAIDDCNAKLGPFFNWLCSVTYLVKSVCYIVKVFDVICMIVDFINDSIIGTVTKKIKSFIRHIRTMFYVRIKFSHSFSMKTQASKTYKEIGASIVEEVKDRARHLIIIFNFMTSITSLVFLFIVFKVVFYRHKFLTSSRFDNKYMVKYFIDIDLKRAKLGKETILPLSTAERTKYVAFKSFRLAKWEKKNLAKSSLKLLTAAMKLGSYMAIDYLVYWVATKIKYYGSYGSKVQAPGSVTLNVEGKAIFAELLRSIVKAFSPNIPLELELGSCLPNAIPPDYDKYIQIGVLLILCAILTFLEPYGLRIRNWVMCYYYPIRAKQRSVWLYNQILRSRTSFLKIARRFLRRKTAGNRDHVTLKDYLKYLLAKCKILRLFFNLTEEEACLMCGQVSRGDEATKLTKCYTPGCLGAYCKDCFRDLLNVCTICKSPIEYGDISDLSEEKDSSEEELENRLQKKVSIDESLLSLNKRNRDYSSMADFRHEENENDKNNERKNVVAYPVWQVENEKSSIIYLKKTGTSKQ